MWYVSSDTCFVLTMVLIPEILNFEVTSLCLIWMWRNRNLISILATKFTLFWLLNITRFDIIWLYDPLLYLCLLCFWFLKLQFKSMFDMMNASKEETLSFISLRTTKFTWKASRLQLWNTTILQKLKLYWRALSLMWPEAVNHHSLDNNFHLF